MPFVKFTAEGRKRGRPPMTEPQISIYRTGAIAFCREAIERFSLEAYSSLELYYDPEGKEMGILPTNEVGDSTYRLSRHQNGAITFSGTAFLNCYKIEYEATRRYKARWEKRRWYSVQKEGWTPILESGSMIVVDLSPD